MTEAPNELRFSFTGSREHRAVFIDALGKGMGLCLIFNPPAYNSEQHKFEEQVLISGRCNRDQKRMVSNALSGLGMSSPNVRFEDMSKWVITSTPDRLIVRFLEFQECIK